MRRKLRSRLEKGERLEIDFAGVEVLTPSFADECLGRLVLDVGLEVFRERVRLKATDETIKRLVNHVLAHRSAQVERARAKRG
ncbi:MAG: STAS-like domain-containing protein [Planctomycetota bacterium]